MPGGTFFRAFGLFGKSKNEVRSNDGYYHSCLLYTSDAADEEDSVDLGGLRIINKKKQTKKKKTRTAVS